MTSTEFEILTQKLFAKRLKKNLGHLVKVKHQKTFKSLTGNVYKIDVSYSLKLSGFDYLTLVECKYWNSYVTREKVGYFKAILDDLKAQKGIIVTTKGFQKGAVTYAKSQNIGLVKITNSNYFERYSNFDGDLKMIEKFLISEGTFNEKDNYTSMGLFSPHQNINDFLRIRYGVELPNFLDKPYHSIHSEFKKQLQNLPDSWYEEYTVYETAGLIYKMTNEPDLRLINTVLLLLSTEEENN